jgi:protein-tyrosine phosphatase
VIKGLLLLITSILLLLTASFAWAKYTQPWLVLDMRNTPELPKHFRASSDSVPAIVNTNGLAELHAAGGAQFSKLSLQQITQHLQTKKILIIDLRQESHGMLNSNAISWYGHQNAENAGEKPQQIEKQQAQLLSALGKEKIAVVEKVIQKSANGNIEKGKPVEYMVHQTSSEEELVSDMKMKYKRIYVQDFHAPSDKEVDRFLEIAQSIPAGKWVYFHCRAGIGRTTLFLSMYDMLRNAKKVSLDDILMRQNALGGKDLTQLPPKNHFKYQWAADRLNFIKKFYEYAHENKDGFKTSWSEWVRAQQT